MGTLQQEWNFVDHCIIMSLSMKLLYGWVIIVTMLIVYINGMNKQSEGKTKLSKYGFLDEYVVMIG